MITAGIDAGSRTIKVVIFDHASGRVAASALADQGIEQFRLAQETYSRALESAGLEAEKIQAVAATGYGRNRVSFAQTTFSEISCHAQGVYHLAPDARSVIEIGGQDSKVIRLDPGGRVRDFEMNDRCAAGTGRFLEMLSARLGVALGNLCSLSAQSRCPSQISSTCAVFAETEIVGLLADGAPPADLAAGVQQALASRIAIMCGRALEPAVYFTGGVALQPGMRKALESALGTEIGLVPNPQYSGALGAALLAGKLCTQTGLS